MEALHARIKPHGRQRHVPSRPYERSENVGDEDDPRFIESDGLKPPDAEQAESADGGEHLLLEQYLAEAERRYWASHGDPETEIARLTERARRRLATEAGEEGDR